MRGEFTLRGVEPAAEPARAALRLPHATPAREVCGGDFEAELLRSDFGMTFGLPFVGDRVRLLVQVEAIADR